MRPQFRWLGSIVLPGLLLAGVVALSLAMHRRTFASLTRLMETAGRLEETQRWFQRAEQCFLELTAPGHAVLADWQVSAQRARQELARLKLEAAVAQGQSFGVDVTRLRHLSRDISVRAGEVFEAIERAAGAADDASRAEALAAASRAAARMDADQMDAIRQVGFLAERVRAEQRTSLDEHEVSLQARLSAERYVVTIVVVMSVGLAWFGWRLHRTDRALAAQRLETEAARRERLAAIGELCSGVAHGIRNPLAAIRSSTQLTLELGTLDDASRSRLQDVLAEGTRLGDRVTGLLKMAGAAGEPCDDICLKDTVQAAVAGLGPELDRLGLTLRRSVDDAPVRVRGDRRQLEQLVIELVSNAMEQTPRGGTIELTCRGPGGNGRAPTAPGRGPMALVAVDDSGPGVARDLRSEVFQLFFTTKPQGTGIGLATVRRIVQRHRGEVRLCESPLGGARFEVWLPASARATAPRRRARQSSGA